MALKDDVARLVVIREHAEALAGRAGQELETIKVMAHLLTAAFGAQSTAQTYLDAAAAIATAHQRAQDLFNSYTYIAKKMTDAITAINS